MGVVFVSAAAAATIRGTARGETIRGTARADFIDPGPGRDRVLAGSGNDRIKAHDGFVDDIRCGPGRDIVSADLADRVAADCEVVSRRLAVDRTRAPGAHHATMVEPDSYSWGSSLVAIYQVGRYRDGAAAANGFSTTHDAGRTWRSGLLPGLTPYTTPAGPWARATDPVIGYDAAHGVWLASSLVVTPRSESALTFNRSTDGITWSAPVVATRSVARELQLDKQWFVCDNFPSSPFYGNCYLAYSDFRTNRISVQVSSDGGLTWSAPIGSPDNAGRAAMRVFSPGVQPVVRPNGDVLVLFYDDEQMSSIRSSDGGRTFSRTEFVARAAAVGVPRFRAFSLPSADVDSAGTVYLSWLDCGFRRRCDGGDLVFTRSTNGSDWTPRARIPLGPQRAGGYFALPGLAADPDRPGRLALAYYRIQPGGSIDAFFVSSPNGGRSWLRPQRLSPESMLRAWLPPTTLGPMIGDYISTSWVGGRPLAIVIYASRPRAGRFDQSVFAARP